MCPMEVISRLFGERKQELSASNLGTLQTNTGIMEYVVILKGMSQPQAVICCFRLVGILGGKDTVILQGKSARVETWTHDSSVLQRMHRASLIPEHSVDQSALEWGCR